MKQVLVFIGVIALLSCNHQVKPQAKADAVAMNCCKAGATCTGSSSCRACKNCKYCKHCSKDGGTCGVCK